MEIRLLYRNELQWAVYTANEAFETLVRPYAGTQEEVEPFYRYVRVENLWQEMSAGRLFLWGAFENGQMCAVSAMQDVGHITMLYVRPQYGARHVGTQLVNHMCRYADAMLHRERVTVHVTPVSAAGFFYHIGFTLVQGSALNGIYVPLERRIRAVPQGYPGYGNAVNPGPAQHMPEAGAPVYGMAGTNPAYSTYAPKKPGRPEVTYPTKKVSTRCIVALVAGIFLFSFAVFAGVTVHHLVNEGTVTESGEQNGEEGSGGAHN